VKPELAAEAVPLNSLARHPSRQFGDAAFGVAREAPARTF
jgi:hypothetical protein